jgi:Ca2+-binding RTX toxin-like protein
MDGNGGNDLLSGDAGNDHLVAFDDGHDRLYGNKGADTLHGYLVQHQPGDLSYVVEDHQADHLHGGWGNDTLLLGSGDVGTGGGGADTFEVSWDVQHGHPAQITDYDPRHDKLFVEFTSNHADADLTAVKPEETNVTTGPLKDGSGSAIYINGQPIAHVLGTTTLQASDVGLIRN